MKTVLLGIGDIGISNDPEEILKTCALGSCVAVIILNPSVRAAAMAHIALPCSSTNIKKARLKPGYFADTGIPALLKLMNKVSSNGTRKNLFVKIVGGAQIMDKRNTFNIGKRNVLAIKKILWSYGLGVIAEDTGGDISRTVIVPLSTGKVIVSSPGLPEKYI